MRSIVVIMMIGVMFVHAKRVDSLTKYQQTILVAETIATTQARKVLEVTRKMVAAKEVVKGACWDFLNAAFLRAGFTNKLRRKIFASKKVGPYASVGMLQPGDWVYHINHSYHGIEHSGMFIAWIDRGKHIALMLSYAGEGREEPARYKPYDLSSVYHIMRVGPDANPSSNKSKS